MDTLPFGVGRSAKGTAVLRAAMLAGALIFGAHAPAWAQADERPDLKIELANVPIENLDPGQSTMFSYVLSGACAGQTVRAQLAPAANYAGVKESNVANNLVESMACGPAPQPPLARTAPPAGDVTATGTFVKPSVDAGAATRDVLAPRVVTVTFIPNATAGAIRGSQERGLRPAPFVGWSQDGNEDNPVWTVEQTAINFDLRFLQQVPGTRVREAILRYSESYGSWRDGGISRLTSASCVEALGRATEEWQGRPSTVVPAQFGNDKVQGHTPGVREWFVTSEIRDQWIDSVYPPLGFVLRGGNESPDGKSQASCLSELSNITLEIVYEVPQ